MTCQRFEDLPVWKEAMRLAHRVFDLTEDPRFKISFSLRDQIERSVLNSRRTTRWSSKPGSGA